ncbi:MAG: hypothetical protein R2724_12460 [Bryobacterales bacterium]
MALSRPALALFALTGVYAALAAPELMEQWERPSALRASVGRLTGEERAQALDNPAVPVAERIAAAVPADGCVSVLAYAGPAAIDYYNARLDYLLYPRRVQVYPNVTGALEDCDAFAVFRDTQQNLALEPFQGEWDDAALAERIRGAERLGGDEIVSIYRSR